MTIKTSYEVSLEVDLVLNFSEVDGKIMSSLTRNPEWFFERGNAGFGRREMNFVCDNLEAARRLEKQLYEAAIKAHARNPHVSVKEAKT